MIETLRIGDLSIRLTRKDVKHVHLNVHPPEGRVTMVAPPQTRTEVARAYAVTRLGWIRKQQAGFLSQARETPRRYVERESHMLWGRRHLLTVRYSDGAPSVSLDHRRIVLTVRPDTPANKRAELLHAWHKTLLHAYVPMVIRKWERRIGVRVSAYFLQRMKTKWGSCNAKSRNIRLNTQLIQKPKDLLEYVVAHELVHLLEPTHSERFIALMDKHYPQWREARSELNELPLAAETWK